MSRKKSQLEKFINSQLADEIIATVIIINAISLFLLCSESMHQRFGWWLEQIDHYALIFFIIELFVRLYVSGWGFFKSKWNIYDTFIIIISILPHAGYFSALRALRILRLVRLIRFFPKMQILIISIKDATTGIISILFFLTLFFLVFAIMTFNLFKGMNGEYFSSITYTLMSMFQLMTNDGWAEIVRPVQKIYPYANIFFIFYIIIMKFILLNLFFGLIVNSVQNAARKETKNAIDILKTNIEEAKGFEVKLEVSLEHKIDRIMEEIRMLKSLMNKSH